MASDISEKLRAEVAKRASYRCEYCRIHEDDSGFPHQVDHIVSRKHGASSGLDNLAFACVICTRYKGSDVASLHPVNGEAVRLFHPRRDAWEEHFRLDSVRLEALTEVGKATAILLRMNSPERVAEREALGWRGISPL